MQTLHSSYSLPRDTLVLRSTTNGVLMNLLIAVPLGIGHGFFWVNTQEEHCSEASCLDLISFCPAWLSPAVHSVQVSLGLYQHLALFNFYIYNPIGVKWYLIVLIYISLITSGVECYSYTCLTFWLSPSLFIWVKSSSSSWSQHRYTSAGEASLTALPHCASCLPFVS